MNVHPNALCSSHAKVGEYAYVGAFSVVEPRAEIGEGSRIGAHCMVAGNVVVGEQCVVGDACTLEPGLDMEDEVILGPGVTSVGFVLLSRGVQVGARAVLIGPAKGSPMIIKAKALIEPGTVVTEEVAAGLDLSEEGE